MTMFTIKMLTIKEVCEMLRISKFTAYRWIKSGRLKASQIGKKYLFKEEDIKDLLK
jgi:excisionase family DNA binding protein